MFIVLYFVVHCHQHFSNLVFGVLSVCFTAVSSVILHHGFGELCFFFHRVIVHLTEGFMFRERKSYSFQKKKKTRRKSFFIYFFYLTEVLSQNESFEWETLSCLGKSCLGPTNSLELTLMKALNLHRFISVSACYATSTLN